MDTNNTIHFIKSSRGLRLDKKIFYKVLFVLPLMFSLVLFNAEQLENIFTVVSVSILMIIFAIDICCLFCLGKKSLKYKLLLRPIIVLNVVVPLFYIACLVFYDTFGLNSFLFYYLLPSVVLSLLVVLAGFFVISGKTKSKIKAAYTVLGCSMGSTTILISRGINDVMSETLSENMHFLVITVLMLLLNSFMFSVLFFDLLRFYYYTKLEKAGLVTEDILKLEE